MEYFLYSFELFLLIWARISAAFFVVPVISSRYIPIRVRAIASLLMAILIFPWASRQGVSIPDSMGLYALVVGKELVVGLVLGFILYIIFASFQLAAQFFSIQIGLGVAQVLDPITQEETPLMGYLFYAVAILVFLNINGLHMVLLALADSYTLLPVIHIGGQEMNFIEIGVRYFSLMFVIALKIAIPIIAASLLILITLGLLGKVAPQTNVLILGLPIQLGVGMIMILLLIPYMAEVFGRMMETGINDAMVHLRRLSP